MERFFLLSTFFVHFAFFNAIHPYPTDMLFKVCCIKSLKEAESALALGADLLGFVSEMPSGPGVISLSLIASIIDSLPSGVKSVLLTSKLTAHEIIAQHHAARAWGLQLVDAVSLSEIERFHNHMPDVKIIQVVHVSGQHSLDQALAYANNVDYLLLDSGQPDNRLKTLGGTGNIHDWQISEQICHQSPVPVFLAGGLKAENIVRAIRTVRPSGVDVCSGIRTKGNLDISKLETFLQTARSVN